MKLDDYINPGDWLLFFPKKNSVIGNIISKLTFGKVCHAAICSSYGTLFETDGDFMKSKFTPSSEYDGKRIIIISVKGIQGKEIELLEVCNKYKDYPYSYFDLVTNAMFFWLVKPLRKKVVGFLGNKKFMVCSELVARITYELTNNEELRDYEALTPEDLLEIARSNPDKYIIQNEYIPN